MAAMASGCYFESRDYESMVGLFCSPSEEDNDDKEEVGDKEMVSSPLSPSSANGTFVEDE